MRMTEWVQWGEKAESVHTHANVSAIVSTAPCTNMNSRTKVQWDKEQKEKKSREKHTRKVHINASKIENICRCLLLSVRSIQRQHNALFETNDKTVRSAHQNGWKWFLLRFFEVFLCSFLICLGYTFHQILSFIWNYTMISFTLCHAAFGRTTKERPKVAHQLQKILVRWISWARALSRARLHVWELVDRYLFTLQQLYLSTFVRGTSFLLLLRWNVGAPVHTFIPVKSSSIFETN